LRTLIVVAAGTFALSIAGRAAAAGPSENNRGYDGCLAGRYDEAQHSHSYGQGCGVAEDERGMDETPRHWSSTVGIPNVNGMDPAQALAAMQSRGYRNVGTSVAGGMIVGIYFNSTTGECVQLTSANNRVVDARANITDRRCQ
jgi:hypothetical protein